MSYGMNFGMPFMNFNMMTPMNFLGNGNHMDNWQYSFFAGPGKSSLSYPVDTLSFQNDMALRSFVDSTYNMVPQIQTFYTNAMKKLQDIYQQFYTEMQSKIRQEQPAKETQETPETEDDTNIDPTHDDEKAEVVEETVVPVETEEPEKTAEEEPAKTETVEEPEKTEEPDKPEETDKNTGGDKSYRGSLEDKSTFDEQNEKHAKALYRAMHGPGTKDKLFNDTLQDIDEKNVIEVMEAYKENYAPKMQAFGFFGDSDYNLIDSIVDDFSGKERDKHIKYIGNLLINRAKALTDKKDEKGNVIEDPKVEEFRKLLESYVLGLDDDSKEDIDYKFENFKDWIRELEGTQNKRIIMDTNAHTTV